MANLSHVALLQDSFDVVAIRMEGSLEVFGNGHQDGSVHECIISVQLTAQRS